MYYFATIEEAANYLIDNSKNLSSEEIVKIKAYIKDRFNLSKTEIIDIIIKAINKRKDLKD